MYRYFMVKDEDLPKLEDNYGEWHCIHLGSHGKSGKGWNALVLHSHDHEVPSGWQPFPKVVDHKAAIRSKVDHKLLADLGVTGNETTFELTERLAEVFHPMGHP